MQKGKKEYQRPKCPEPIDFSSVVLSSEKSSIFGIVCLLERRWFGSQFDHVVQKHRSPVTEMRCFVGC